MSTMDTYHPEMQRWAEQMRQQRQQRERQAALRASIASQAAAKQQNHQHDLLLQAARLAGV